MIFLKNYYKNAEGPWRQMNPFFSPTPLITIKILLEKEQTILSLKLDSLNTIGVQRFTAIKKLLD